MSEQKQNVSADTKPLEKKICPACAGVIDHFRGCLVANLRTALAERDTTIDHLESEIRRINYVNDELRKENERLRAEVERLKNRVFLAELGSVEKNEDDEAEAADCIIGLQHEENAVLRAGVAELEAERDAARDEAAELKRLAGEVLRLPQFDVDGQCIACCLQEQSHEHESITMICIIEKIRAHLSTTTETPTQAAITAEGEG